MAAGNDMLLSMPTAMPHDRREADTINILVRVRPEELVFLNGLMETYDDLAVIRTLDGPSGLAVVMVSPGNEAVARAVLDSVAAEIGLEYPSSVAAPDDLLREKIYGLF